MVGSAARRAPHSGHRRVRRRHARRRHDDARPRRVGLLGGDRRRLPRRVARSRSGPTWTACSPPIRASSTRSAGRAAPVVRRGVGAGLLRRQGAAPGDHSAGRRQEHPGAHPQLAAAEAPRHAHHAPSARRADRPLTALASKKGVTVVDITSTRMLMAHGFLRRLFEVFERHQTPVDVVTTSEVSVSVTVDDTAPPAGDRRGAVGVRRGDAASRHGDRLRRRRRAAARAGVRRPGARGARGRADADGVAGRGAPEHHVRDSRGATCRRRSAGCTSSSSHAGSVRRHPLHDAALLLVGHGRMGQLVESLAPTTASRWPAIVTRAASPTPSLRRLSAAVDVAIDFTLPEAVPANLPQLAARGINVVIGTTGWQAHEAGAARPSRPRRHRRGGVGELLARHEPLPARWSRSGAAFAAHADVRRLDPRGAPRGEEGRAVGHGADAAAGDERGRLRARRSTCRRRAPASIPGTHTVGFDGPSETVDADAHGARPRPCSPAARSRRRGGSRPARLVHACGTS